MRPFSVIFTVLSTLFLSVLAAPLPLGQSLDKRQGTGRGTWFYDNTNESACGDWDQNTDIIVAISKDIYNSGAHCGQGVWITVDGNTQYATVTDKCQGCGPGDLDMSPSLFQRFAPLTVGVLSISWGWS